MDLPTLLANAYTYVQNILVPLGGVILLLGLAAWGLSRPLEDPGIAKIGRRSVIGGLALASAPTLIALLKSVATALGFAQA